METLISAAGQSRSRSWRKCADIIGRTVLKFHERSRRSNFIFLAHFRLLFTLSITLTALQALFLATFQKRTPSYVTSDYVAFLALYWLYKVNKVMCDFPDESHASKQPCSKHFLYSARSLHIYIPTDLNF